MSLSGVFSAARDNAALITRLRAQSERFASWSDAELYREYQQYCLWDQYNGSDERFAEYVFMTDG